MDIVSSLVVFILLWWWAFFMVLPWGNQPPEDIEKGHATSAPARPRMIKKLMVTTGLAVVFFIFTYWIITSGFFTFRGAE
ncbi:MAG: DUF1467 family protein [Candidatus Puniceispirillaceae bacterium]